MNNPYHNGLNPQRLFASLVWTKLLLLLSLSAFSVSAQQTSPKIEPGLHVDPTTVVIATQEWPPYHSQSNNIQSGYAIDALACIMDKLNQKFKIVFVPWGRAQNGVKNQKYDAFFSASRSEWRDQFAVLSRTFIHQQWNFYFHKDYPIPSSLNKMKKNTIFGTRIHSNTAYWLAKHKFQRVKPFPSIHELIKLLNNKRIDAIMENALLFDQAIEQAGVSPNNFIMKKNMRYDLGVYFGKHFLMRYPSFLKRFNRYTQECQFSPTQ